MFRKFFAGFFATMFVMISVPLVFIMGVYNTLGDKDFYTGDLADETYDVLITASPAFFEEGDFSSLSDDELRGIVQKVLTKDDFKGVIADIHHSISGSKFKNAKLDIILPMDWFLLKKDVLAAEFTDILFDDSENVDLPKLDYQSQLAQDLNNQLFVDVPSELVFTMDVPENVEGTVVDYFNHIFNLFLSVVWSLLFMVLVLIALLIFKPWQKVLVIEFKTLFLAFLFLIITLFILLLLSHYMISESNSMIVSDIGDLEFDFYNVLIANLFVGVFWKLFPVALFFLLLSLGLWITLIRYNNKNNEPS